MKQFIKVMLVTLALSTSAQAGDLKLGLGFTPSAGTVEIGTSTGVDDTLSFEASTGFSTQGRTIVFNRAVGVVTVGKVTANFGGNVAFVAKKNPVRLGLTGGADYRVGNRTWLGLQTVQLDTRATVLKLSVAF